MAHFSVKQYDSLEQSVTQRRRIAIYRRGTEYVVIPDRLTLAGGREAVEATHPTTGESMTFFLDELDGFEIVP
jgi:hypothetical protein